MLKNTMMHVRRAAGIHQIDSLSLSSAMLQQLLHGMQREVAVLNDEIRKDPDDYGAGIVLSKLLGSIWHVAFFVSDQIYYPAPSPANKGGAWVTPAKMNGRRGSIRELSETPPDQSPTRMLATPRFQIVERVPSPIRKDTSSVGVSPTSPASPLRTPQSSSTLTTTTNGGSGSPMSKATTSITANTTASTTANTTASTTANTGGVSKTRYMDSGLQLVDGLLRLLIDSKLDLWSEAPMYQSTTKKTRGARGARPGGALRVVVHLIVHSVQDALNFVLMNGNGNGGNGGAEKLVLDAEHRDYLSYLEQLMSRSGSVVNTSSTEWQRTMMLAAAELASIARTHALHLPPSNGIYRLLVSLVSTSKRLLLFL